MSEQKLHGKKVAILAADMFERVELEKPRKALEDAGATTEVVSIHDGEIQGFDHFEPANKVKVDKTVEEVSADDFDALLVPGGVGNPDHLRGDENVIAFVRAMVEAKKPLAVICHGPWVLVEAAVAQVALTSWSARGTHTASRGERSEAEVVVADGIVTSRKPHDIGLQRQADRGVLRGAAPGAHDVTALPWCDLAVAVAQLVELRVVVPVVAGSSPVRHPLSLDRLFRLDELDHEVVRALDERYPASRRIGGLTGDLNASGAQRLDRPVDVVDLEGEVVGAKPPPATRHGVLILAGCA